MADCNDTDVIVLFTSGPHLRHNYHGNKTLETMLSGSVEFVGHRLNRPVLLHLCVSCSSYKQRHRKIGKFLVLWVTESHGDYLILVQVTNFVKIFSEPQLLKSNTFHRSKSSSHQQNYGICCQMLPTVNTNSLQFPLPLFVSLLLLHLLCCSL